MQQQIGRAARDLLFSKYPIALTGAGISTESGVPDFRGPSGIWTVNPAAEKRAYRSYQLFLIDPITWWERRLSSPSLLGDLEAAMPNPGHLALTELEGMGILKCVITQNVDGLHEKAGTKNIIEYHGSTLKLRCTSCNSRFNKDEFDLQKLRRENKLPPCCSICGGVIKTDSVAFGEPIPREVANRSIEEARKCDLMLICGTSAVVYPFADLPRIARQINAARIVEVNTEPTYLTYEKISDYLIRGKTGKILPTMVEEIKGLIRTHGSPKTLSGHPN